MTRAGAFVAVIVSTAIGVAGRAAARPDAAEPPPPAPDDQLVGEPDFGPLVEIERISIVGNARTAERLIRRALLVREGDRLRTGDARLLGSRYRVLALGYFRDVNLRLEKGSRRDAVVLTVAVLERGTATLNRLFLGISDLTDVWLGIDAGEANLLGTGVAVSGAVVWAEAPDLAGGEDQLALRLRVADPSVLGSPFGARASFVYNHASEPDLDPAVAVARGYRRIGGVAGATWDFSRLATLGIDLRLERVSAADPAPAWLRAGDSLVSTVAAGIDVDRRPDPVLPFTGDRLAVVVEGGAGDYTFLRAGARYGIWRPIAGRHIGALQLGGGVIVGDAPLFDRFYVGDLNPLLPPRALDLVVSTRPSPDLLGTGMADIRYGRYAALASFEYAYQLFRWAHTVYGGDLFASVGLFGLGDEDRFAVDLTFNAGLRLDTAIGVFELSLGNALGRIPF